MVRVMFSRSSSSASSIGRMARSKVLAPAVQTVETELPQTPLRATVTPEVCADHEVPFHLRTAPPSPTAQTLLLSLPQTPRSVVLIPELETLQAVPFHFRMVPPSPTA